MEEILYQGNVRVYLQGNNALFPTLSPPKTREPDEITYFIGNESTKFIVCDHRPHTVAEARDVITTHYQNGFVKHFNQVARAEIRYDPNGRGIKIDLHDADSRTAKCPILWMGILESNIMQGYKTEWEVFKTIDENNSAFVAFIVPAI